MDIPSNHKRNDAKPHCFGPFRLKQKQKLQQLNKLFSYVDIKAYSYIRKQHPTHHFFLGLVGGRFFTNSLVLAAFFRFGSPRYIRHSSNDGDFDDFLGMEAATKKEHSLTLLQAIEHSWTNRTFHFLMGFVPFLSAECVVSE